MTLEPVQFWQHYAEWYAQPRSLSEQMRLVQESLVQVAEAMRAHGVTMAQAAAASKGLAEAWRVLR